MEVWQQWKIAQQTSGRLSQVHHPNHKWVKPAAGFMKRNVNASILAQRSAMFTMDAACSVKICLLEPIASRAAAQARLRFCTCAVSTGFGLLA
ncbi:hypothetical protein D5086_014908 [Populus alba]|uniref:Uncharacterized protein n=1 Tax=Populus alba TaxID=43335 RepID=A0ACC4BZG5_POPAL